MAASLVRHSSQRVRPMEDRNSIGKKEAESAESITMRDGLSEEKDKGKVDTRDERIGTREDEKGMKS